MKTLFSRQMPMRLQVLLESYLLEKAIYELGYELNNRPDWVSIPISGILHVMGSIET